MVDVIENGYVTCYMSLLSHSLFISLLFCSTAIYESSVNQGPTNVNVASLQDVHTSAYPPSQFLGTSEPMQPQVAYFHQPEGVNNSSIMQPNPTANVTVSFSICC